MNNQRVIVIKHCLLADVLVLVLQRACSACRFAVPPLTLMALRFRLPVARHTTVFASSETTTVHNTDSRSLICSVKTVVTIPPLRQHTREARNLFINVSSIPLQIHHVGSQQSLHLPPRSQFGCPISSFRPIHLRQTSKCSTTHVFLQRRRRRRRHP